MLVPDDIAAWAVAQLSISAITATVSGGMWNGRPDENAVSPYGVFLVSRQGNTEYTSAAELPRFDLRLAVMTDQAATGQAQGVQITVGTALPLVPTGLTASIRNGAGTVISCVPKECSADTAFPLRGKTDVVACRMAWDVWCQAASTGV